MVDEVLAVEEEVEEVEDGVDGDDEQATKARMVITATNKNIYLLKLMYLFFIILLVPIFIESCFFR